MSATSPNERQIDLARHRSWFGSLLPDETPPRVALASLVVVNLLPLFGVLLWDWDVGAIVVLYWSENLILGAITLIKMLAKAPIAGLFQSLFFTFHYGAFCAVHGLFILNLMLGVDGDPFGDGNNWPFLLVFVELLVNVVNSVLANAPGQWLWVFAALAVSHGVSLVFNYFGSGEAGRMTLSKLMTAPYKRIVILHVAIIVGGMGIMALGEPIAMLVVLVLLKLAMDVVLHRREHRVLEPS